MKMILLGTGTSQGIPCIGCDCAVCRSKDRHDKRLRCSAYATHKNKDGSTAHILIDTGPEFRIQALRHKIKSVDSVLLTHSHADHLHGLDDLRIFRHTKSSDETADSKSAGLPVYANKNTIKDVKSRFSYIFNETQEGGGKPNLHLIDCKTLEENIQPQEFGEIHVAPVKMMHGAVKTTGWLLSCTGKDNLRHSIAYLTDCNGIKNKSVKKIRDCAGTLDHLVIDGLRIPGHSTHFSFLEALTVADKIGAGHTWLTHITHLNTHEQIKEYIALHLNEFPNLAKIVKDGGSVSPAYDGLTLKI